MLLLLLMKLPHSSSNQNLNKIRLILSKWMQSHSTNSSCHQEVGPLISFQEITSILHFTKISVRLICKTMFCC